MHLVTFIKQVLHHFKNNYLNFKIFVYKYFVKKFKTKVTPDLNEIKFNK